MRLLAVIALICLFWRDGHALTYGTVKVTCPLDGKVFDFRTALSGTRFGTQLDMKPLGPIAAPWPLARCPSNGFVIYKDEFTKAELKKLRAFVAAKRFRELREEKSAYYVAAKLQEYMGEPRREVAWTLLQATWEAGDRYDKIASEALAAHVKVLADGGLDADDLVTAQLVAGELERRLGLFDAAKTRFSQLKGRPEFQDGYVAAIIGLQLKLIQDQDRAAHPIPREFAALKGPSAEERRALATAEGLAGYDEMRRRFRIEKAMVGSINMMPESLHVQLQATTPSLLDAAWWWNPILDGKPRLDWLAFLRAYEAATAAASKHTWLAKWKAAERDRTLEVHVLGEGIGESQSDLTTFVLPPWREAQLMGEPGYTILARRGTRDWSQIYFSKSEPRALVTKHSPDRNEAHWFDATPKVYFHPRCSPAHESARFLVIEPDGKWQAREFANCEQAKGRP